LKLENDNTQSAKRIAKLEAQINEKANAHKAELARQKEEIEESNANVELEKVKQEITENEKDRVQKKC
jgi:hypothetical protein